MNRSHIMGGARTMLPVVVVVLLCGGAVASAQSQDVSSNGETVSKVSPLTDQQESQLRERNELAWEVIRLREAGKTELAVTAVTEMLVIERRLFGKHHKDLAGALEWSAKIYASDTDFESAHACLQEAIAIRTEVSGSDHWQTVDGRYALERIERLAKLDRQQRRDYRNARELFRSNAHKRGGLDAALKAVELQKELLGEFHPEFGTALDELTETYFVELGTLPNRHILDLYQQVLTIRERSVGQMHPDYAASLERLASYLSEYGDQTDGVGEADKAKVQTMLRQALAIREAKQGKLHPDTAWCLINLGKAIYRSEGNLEESIRLTKRAGAIYENAEMDWGLSRANGNLLLYYEQMGKYDEVEANLLHELALAREPPSKDSGSRSGDWESTLGMRPERAALARLNKPFINAARHASALKGLFQFYVRRADYQRAVRMMPEFVEAEAEMDLASLNPGSVGRGGFGTGAIQEYLSLLLNPQAALDRGAVYQSVLAWKGSRLLHQKQLRQCRERPELAPLYAELQSVSDQLATEALSSPAPENRVAWRNISELGQREFQVRFELDVQLRQLGFKQFDEPPSLAQLQSSLPADAVLIDFVRFFAIERLTGGSPPAGWRSIAFVVRSKGPVEAVDLGPMSRLEELIDRLHRDVQAGFSMAPRSWFWDRLEPYLHGVGSLLISPDGALCRFPFAAIEGRTPHTHLIDEMAIAMVPIPQLLVSDAGEIDSSGDLLLVGDVDFGAEAGGAVDLPDLANRSQIALGSEIRGRQMQFPMLPGMRREIEAVRDLFMVSHADQSVRMLTGSQASEEAVRRAMSGRRFVHLATHGFFDPPELARFSLVGRDVKTEWLRVTQAGIDPGLFAGIAFAGANRQFQAGQDDGLLTALEAQQLDLTGTELVVLSACETSLGKPVNGEGLLGLQRAFQVAGARSLISSLWKVDDAATQILMIEFYKNLWEKKFSKLEALRQAQLTIRREYDPKTKQLRGPGTIKPIDADRLATASDARKQAGEPVAPFYWAAFVISGDWR